MTHRHGAKKRCQERDKDSKREKERRTQREKSIRRARERKQYIDKAKQEQTTNTHNEKHKD